MFSSHICEALHADHGATVELAERIGALIERHRRSVPDTASDSTARLLGDIPPAFDASLAHHFAFEEAELFSHLAAVGDSAIGAHLTDEHQAMLPLGRELAALARSASAAGFDATRWESFRKVGGELCQRLLEHVQKEEMVLLPLLEESLDPAADARLFNVFAGND